MSDKFSGIDFDRQVFVQPRPPASRPPAPIAGILVALAIIVALVFLGYKVFPQLITQGFGRSSDTTLTDLDKRLADIDRRLDKLEAARRTQVVAKRPEPTEPKIAPVNPPVKTVYQISPPPPQPFDPAPGSASRRDPATAQRLRALQGDTTANREAWQATTDKLADMAGQVGTQSVAILRNQDELNQLLARTEMEAIPFELRRHSNPEPVGPVSLVLKSADSKKQRYTVCVYVQPSCIELKDRMLHEVVQFVAVRNTPPLQIIATKIRKNLILGYLEVPRGQSGH
jgi:hypothetical protein